MGRTVDKQHVHLLYGISICMSYLSHKSINKKQIRDESSMPCTVRHTRVIATNHHLYSSGLMGEKQNKNQTKTGVKKFCSIFIKKSAKTTSYTSEHVYIRAVQYGYPLPQKIIFTWSQTGLQTEEFPIVLLV